MYAEYQVCNEYIYMYMYMYIQQMHESIVIHMYMYMYKANLIVSGCSFFPHFLTHPLRKVS